MTHRLLEVKPGEGSFGDMGRGETAQARPLFGRNRIGGSVCKPSFVWPHLLPERERIEGLDEKRASSGYWHD